ncbi:carbohydrate ABC transporter membrane protein 2 (CUT1 family) [Pseudogracilibacillus auburnensis]|uniref:Carbohydrate ABC transporter membrane protein 2 (CUT1 family) n=1 Tax=Pseudogracilibacillus auburnensis TaxID=1494959 RepID=A0A2V3WC17_9BACI|nr:carbohydrate ABC transporter membrane protein 2 (CUT1 family) [Pseudogracilibacillus auburnensis]
MLTKRVKISNIFVHLFLWIGIVFVAFPFLWMILSSFKSLPDFYQFGLLPEKLDISSYKYIFAETEYVRWYANSFLIAVTVTITNLLFCGLIGYTFAKFDFKGKRIWFVVILSTMMIPTEMLVIPWYVISSELNWIDSYWGIMFPGIIEAFGVFLMRQFFSGVPNDTLDAARIDGMGEFRIWWKIAMPQVKAALSALGILTFLGNWNAYLWPVIVTTTSDMRTLPVGISLYGTSDAGGIQWNTIMGMSTLAVVPMIIVFLIFQTRIVEGISLTGGK